MKKIVLVLLVAFYSMSFGDNIDKKTADEKAEEYLNCISGCKNQYLNCLSASVYSRFCTAEEKVCKRKCSFNYNN